VSPELDARLVADFPRLYRMRHAGTHETTMAWGFCCGDGWEPLIRRASEQLEAMILAMPRKQQHTLYCDGIKEKFGSIRMATSIYNDAIAEIVDRAYQESVVTCEFCGAAGELRSGGWIRTLCDGCDLENSKSNGGRNEPR